MLPLGGEIDNNRKELILEINQQNDLIKEQNAKILQLNQQIMRYEEQQYKKMGAIARKITRTRWCLSDLEEESRLDDRLLYA